MRSLVIIMALAAAAMFTAEANAQSKQMAAELMVNYLLKAKEPQEIREIKDPGNYREMYVAETYAIAASNADALDKQFCYCYCALNPKVEHKSLKSCFVDDHGAHCGICMKQARTTAAMTKEGKSPKEIAEHFKEKYLHAEHDHKH